ncbi:g7957 [Coccomyxa elongata]
MEQLVQELQEKLRKSEASRVRLRDSLRQLKERAVDTSELVWQHQQLQVEVAKKAEEAEEHRLAREKLRRELEAAKDASKRDEDPAEREDEGLTKRLQARLDKGQQTAAEAVSAARKSEHECLNLQKQSAQLRERIKELEHKQKAGVGDVVHIKGQLGKQATAMQSMGQQLSSLLQQQAAFASQQAHTALAQQVAQLEGLVAASTAACEAARADRERLWQRLDAMQTRVSTSMEQQQATLQQVSRWQAAFGAFARKVGCSPRLRRPGGGGEAGPAPVDGLGEAGDGLQLVPYSNDESASSGSRSSRRLRQAGTAPRMPGEGARLPQPAAEAACASTGTVAGPAEGFPRLTPLDRPAEQEAHPPPAAKRQRLVASGSGVDEGSNAVRTPTGTVLTPRQHHERVQADAPRLARPSSAAAHRATPEAEGGSAASGTAVTKAWKSESAAVSVVEGWLGELTGCVEQPVSAELVQGAAAGLRNALCAGQCPLTCIIAGFETALLECAAPRGFGCSLSDEGVGGASSSSSIESGRIEDITFSAVWCRQEVLQAGSFTGLLASARALERLLLQARGPRQQEGFMEVLLRRLHTAAVRPPPGLQTALHTEACAAAAACAALYRAQGNMQAMRVLVFDMVTSEAELTARLLPRLAAAVLSWPTALTPDPTPSAGLLGPALLAALHDLSFAALCDQGRAVDDTVTAAGSVSGTTSATDLRPGVPASAAALLTVCERAGVPARSGKQTHDARSGAQTHDAWPASLAALKATLLCAAAMGKESAAQPDSWHDIACALQAACVCLGTARCRDEALAVGGCKAVAGHVEPAQRAKLWWPIGATCQGTCSYLLNTAGDPDSKNQKSVSDLEIGTSSSGDDLKESNDSAGGGQGRHSRALGFLKTLTAGCTDINEEELENLLAVLAETPPSEACPDAEPSHSLPWLEIPLEVFCVLLLRLVHRDQAYRRTCAALEVLRLRLESLTAPASRTLVLTIVQAGVWHSLPLAQVVLGKLVARPGLNTAQAELLIKVMKECRASVPQLAADLFEAVADEPEWGSAWNENTVSVMSQIVTIKPAVPLDRIQKHVAALCAAASLAHLQPSVKFSKLLMSFVTAYAGHCWRQQDELMQAAAKGTSFLAKSCKQKIENLLAKK